MTLIVRQCTSERKSGTIAVVTFDEAGNAAPGGLCGPAVVVVVVVVVVAVVVVVVVVV